MKKWLWSLGVLAGVLVAACSAQQPPAPATSAPTTPAPTVTAKATPAHPSGVQDPALTKLIEAAKKEGSLTIYSFAFTGDVGNTLSKAFKDKYGIKVDIVTGRGAEMVQRIQTETRTGNITADMMEGAATHNTNLKKAGLTVSSGDLPVFQEKDVWRVDPFVNDPVDRNLVGHRTMFYLPLYNTQLLKASDIPASFKDLADPKWNGKFSLSDPNVATAAYDIFVTLESRKLMDESTVKAIGTNKPKFYIGTLQVAEGVAKGDIPVGIIGSDVDAAPYFKAGAPMRPMDFKEGTIAQTSVVTRVKGGPHPNAAALFINWIETQEGQTIFTKVAGLASVRKDVQDARAEAGRLSPSSVIGLTPEEVQASANQMAAKYLVKLWGR